MEITVDQELSTQQEMAVFEQFKERCIKVMVSDGEGEGKDIGVVKHLYPKGKNYRLKLDLSGRINKKNTTGFVFTNFYGTWFLTRPD